MTPDKKAAAERFRRQLSVVVRCMTGLARLRDLMRKHCLTLTSLALLSACAAQDRIEDKRAGAVTHLNPEGLHQNSAFSQVVVASGPSRTIFVGGQNAVDSSGTIVGKGEIGVQAAQVATNLQIALAAAGANVENVVKWTVFAVQGQPVGPALGAFQQVFGEMLNPPAITVVFVSALAHPDFLLEVEAIAVVPEQ